MRPRLRPARSSTALTLIYGLGQSAEVAMRLFLFQKHTNSYLFSSTDSTPLQFNHFSTESAVNSTPNKQQIPLEKIASDCSKSARRPFWNHFESGYCFGPKPSFQTIHLKRWVASMLIESQTKWASSIQHQSKFKGLMVLRSEMEHIEKKFYVQRFVIAHLYFCCCAACAYIFLLVITWAASATGWWLWQRGRSVGRFCMYACLPGL